MASSASVSSASAATALRFEVKNASQSQRVSAGGPLLVRFPRGLPKDFEKAGDKVSFKVAQNRKNTKKQRLEARSSKVRYTGTNFGQSSTSKNLSKYAIASWNIDTGSIRMVVCPHIYKMDQSVNDVENQLEPSLLSPEDRKGERDMLINEFGSVKRKRSYNSAQRARIKLEDKQQTHALDQAMVVVDVTATPDANKTQLEFFSMLPKFDDQTTDRSKIYPIPGLLANSHLSALDPKLSSQLDNACTTVVKLVSTASRIKDKKIRKLRLRLSMYLHYLVTFHNISNRNKSRALKSVACPTVIGEQMLEIFTDKNTFHGKIRHDQARHHTGSLLCRIAIVALLSSGYILPMDLVRDLALTLKMTESALAKYFREVGGKVFKNQIELKAPLKLPKQKRGGRRG